MTQKPYLTIGNIDLSEHVASMKYPPDKPVGFWRRLWRKMRYGMRIRKLTVTFKTNLYD